jgi:hypothetical protein
MFDTAEAGLDQTHTKKRQAIPQREPSAVCSSVTYESVRSVMHTERIRAFAEAIRETPVKRCSGLSWQRIDHTTGSRGNVKETQ